MISSRHALALSGAVLWLALVVPPVPQILQSSMTLQMLVQIPLLAAAGWLASHAAPRHFERALARWNGEGIAGLLLATFAAAVWMLPRMMDASVDDWRFAIAKLVSVPLLIGAPLALSWPRMGFVVRGVFLLESIATAFRMGWLYLASPGRLCSNYLWDDQQQLGRYLILLGVVMCLVVMWKLIWGRMRISGTGAGNGPRNAASPSGTRACEAR
jgi:hypothetical protein